MFLWEHLQYREPIGAYCGGVLDMAHVRGFREQTKSSSPMRGDVGANKKCLARQMADAICLSGMNGVY